VVLAARASEPDTPREVVQAYLEGDPSETWDLMCLRDQEEQGPRERYLREEAAFEEEAAGVDELMDITLGHVRYDEEAGAPRVELLFWSGTDLQFTDEVHVIEERGGLRVCMIPGMGF
jgi:hypothetical protein